jgi:hypothetical protein
LFHESVSPKPLIIPLGPFRIFSKICGGTGGKFAAGIVYTGGKFATGTKMVEKFAAGVVDTCGAP